jgi:hypothetical protein
MSEARQPSPVFPFPALDGPPPELERDASRP